VKQRSIFVLLAAVLFGGCVCFAQRDAAYDTVAPLRANAFTDQVYVGLDHIRTDYALVTASGNQVATTNGVNVEFDRRRREHIAYIASVRYGQGGPFNQTLITGTAGGSYLFHFKRYEPYLHALGGYTRLQSNHAAGGMYLLNVNTGLTMVFGGGLDVKLNERWGVRPISLEDVYLPFGSGRSTYWSVGAGVLYHLGRRHGVEGQ
jgi:hypothetical protein